MLTSRFMEFVVYLSRQYENQEEGMQSNLMHLANAISYIEDHYLEPLSLDEVAVKSGHIGKALKPDLPILLSNDTLLLSPKASFGTRM